jgi:hypothetical protein
MTKKELFNYIRETSTPKPISGLWKFLYEQFKKWDKMTNETLNTKTDNIL